MQKTDFHELSFFAEKVILELKCTNHFFRALRTPILCFNATKQIMRMRRPQMLKNIFLSEKKLLNAILRAKLKYMKNVSF